MAVFTKETGSGSGGGRRNPRRKFKKDDRRRPQQSNAPKYDKDEKEIERAPSQLDLDLSHKEEALKPIPKEVLTKFLKEGIIRISNNANCEHNHMKMDDRTHVMSVFTKNQKMGEDIVNAMMHTVAHELGSFIEKETGEDRKKFYRSITLFESAIEENRVMIRWA